MSKIGISLKLDSNALVRLDEKVKAVPGGNRSSYIAHIIGNVVNGTKHPYRPRVKETKAVKNAVMKKAVKKVTKKAAKRAAKA